MTENMNRITFMSRAGKVLAGAAAFTVLSKYEAKAQSNNSDHVNASSEELDRVCGNITDELKDLHKKYPDRRFDHIQCVPTEKGNMSLDVLDGYYPRYNVSFYRESGKIQAHVWAPDPNVHGMAESFERLMLEVESSLRLVEEAK